MHSAIDELKTRADILLSQARDGQHQALSRLGRLPTLKPLTRQALKQQVQRKHALWAVAREVGFPTWKQAQAVLTGRSGNGDFGTLLYPKRGYGFLNHWYARYHDAQQFREQTNGFLLAYKRQFLVVGEAYIQALGLAPDHTDWDLLGRDWVGGEHLEARGRLYASLIARTRTAP